MKRSPGLLLSGKSGRNSAVDWLKLIMAFMVVGLHTGFLFEYSPIGNYLTVNGLFRIAVPTFMIINGYYFEGISDSHGTSKWLRRVLYLYLIWMLIYLPFWVWRANGDFFRFISIAFSLIMGYHHLWYLPAILLAAIMYLMIKNVDSRYINLVCFLLYFMGILIQYESSYQFLRFPHLDRLAGMAWLHRNFLFMGFPMFYLGVLIRRHQLENHITIKMATLILALGMIFLLFESYINFIILKTNDGFDNFVFLPVVAATLFVFFLKIDFPGDGKNISQYSSGIYFIHPLVQNSILKKTTLVGTPVSLVTMVLSLFFAFFLIKINKKISFLL